MQQCPESCGRHGFELHGWSDEDDEMEEDESYESCPAGQVFCMEIMACVSDCNFFDIEESQENDSDQDEYDIICPSGSVSNSVFLDVL